MPFNSLNMGPSCVWMTRLRDVHRPWHADHFKQFGQVTFCDIVRDKDTGGARQILPATSSIAL